MKNNNHRKGRLFCLLTVLVVVAQIVLAIPVNASSVKVYASRDDIYNKLEEAGKLNVIMNNLKKCFNAGSTYNYVSGDASALSGENAQAGKVFYKPGSTAITNTKHSTALWLEDEMGAGSDGYLWCWEGQSDGHGLFHIFMEALEKSASELVCDGGKGRLFRRAKRVSQEYGRDGTRTIYTYDEDVNCNSFNDSDAYYILSDTWETALQGIWQDYINSSGNDFLPSYSNIGSFNNVDGYVNYLLDFNTMCDADKYSEEPSDTTVYPVTKFNNDIANGSVNAKTYWYHVNDNKTWSGALSNDNPITSCTGLLERVETLRTSFNGVHGTNTGYGRSYGYEGSIIYALNNACKDLKTSDGQSAWTVLKTELEAVIDNENATAEEIDKANDSLQKVNSAQSSGKYYSESGDEEDEDGKDYKCLDIEELRVTVQEYDYGSKDFGEGKEGSEADCYTNAGSLGWILCPIIDQGADFVAGIYEKFIQPFLVLDSGLFKQGEEGGEATYEAWTQFQGYANIIFIIIFLFVIFSQLTGYGIDNYGIKKILPKLIVAAILINASYIICQLAVDIANIIGYGIKSILDNIGLISDYSGVHLAENPGGGMKNGFTATSILVLLVGLLTVPAILSQGTAILVPIFIAIIGIVVAIFTLFCLLAIRKAMAVVLVILSPLAFVCYMLPNTKKLFDRWFTTFKGVLLAFPICALMVYGGQAVARIIVHACGSANMPSLMALSAAVMSIAPVFLIPSVLRKSMGAISNMVNAASGRLGHFAKGRADSSRAARYLKHQGDQRMQARQNEFNRKRAQRALNGSDRLKNSKFGRSALGQKIGFGQGLADKDYSKMSAGQRRAFMAAHGTMSSYDQEMASGFRNQAADLNADQASAMLMNSLDKKGGFDVNMAEAAINRMGSLDQGQMLQSLQKFTASEQFKKMDATQRNRFIQTLQKQDGNTVAKAYAKYLGGNGTGSLDDAIKNGDIASQIQGMDKNIIANTDKDVLRFMAGENAEKDASGNAVRNETSGALANSFTSEQMASAMSSGAISGKSEKQFNKVVENRDAALVKNDLSKITTEQFTTTMDSSLESAAKAMDKGGMVGAKEVYNMANGHMRNLQKPGNEQLMQKISKEKYKYK